MPAEIKARPTLYKGIQMRSRLEADYAAHLDQTSDTWEYEPTCFAGPGGQWLPDFRVPGSRTTILQEIKPASLLKPRAGEGEYGAICRMDPILKRMTVAWESEPEACLELVFWTYGAQEPDVLVIGLPGLPWQACAGSSLLLMWPGMGQLADAYLRLEPAGASEEVAANAF